MPSTIETPKSTDRRMPWDVMGGDLGVSDAPVADVLATSGLNYEVRALGVAAFERTNADEPLALANFTEAPTLQAIVRPMPEGGDKVLAVTGSRYTIVQNGEAFAVADDLRHLGAQIVGAADFRGGGSSLLAVKMPQGVTVTTPSGKDYTDLNLVIRNAHDGSASVTFALTPIRLACTNALPVAVSGAAQAWKIRHTPTAQARVSEAHAAILAAAGYAAELQGIAQRMADTRMVDAEFDKIVASMWHADPDDESRKAEQRRQTQEEVRALYATSETLAGVRGTMWGGFNALTEYMDHYRPVKGNTPEAQAVSRAEGSLEGPYVRRKAAIWDRFLAAV